MPFDSLKTLPPAVREELLDDKYVAFFDTLYASYGLTGVQVAVYGDIVRDIIFKKRPVLDFSELLTQRMSDPQNIDLRGLALQTALHRFWPINYYLGNVDLLIRRLGGVVPAPVLPRIVEADDEKGDEPVPADEAPQEGGWVQGVAKEILRRYQSYAELYLTQKPIRDSEDRLKAPTLNNWLQDYLHTVGAEGTGSLKRSKYLTRSMNALALNGPEKQNLLNFLLSYEEGMPMYWHVAEQQYLLIEAEMPTEQAQAKAAQQSTEQMSGLVEKYTSIQRSYQALFEEKKKGLELEINGNNAKIADIVWDALGLGDSERCLAALDLLIDHHWLLETLKTDHRFQGIVSRILGVKYGLEAKNTWNGDLTTGMMLALFWKLVLVDKLGLDEMTAAILADYYRKKLELKASPVYLDLKLGTFLFRDVTYKDRAFSFA